MFEEAKSMHEREKILQDKLYSEWKVLERKRRELSEQLLKTTEEIHKLGVIRNYAKFIENQLDVVKLHLQIEAATDTTKAEVLQKTKEEIEKKLKLVQQAMKKS